MISTIDHDTPRTRASVPALAGGATRPMNFSPQQLAAGRRLDAESLGRLLEVVGAALGQRQRGVGHPPQLQPLLGSRRGDRALEVCPGGLGVVALGGARAEDRLRGGLELGLGLELLVGAALELLHRRQLAALLDPHHSLLLGHRAVESSAPSRRSSVAHASGALALSVRLDHVDSLPGQILTDVTRAGGRRPVDVDVAPVDRRRRCPGR